MEPSEGHSTPRASTSSKLAYNLQPPTPLHGSTTNIILQSPSINSNNNKFSQASTSNSLPVQSQQQQQQILQATPPSKLRINNVVSNSIVDIGSGLRDRRQMLLSKVRGHENVGIHNNINNITENNDILKSKDPAIKEQILSLIEQYLGDEGYTSTKLVLHDEAKLKGKERDERANDNKKLKRAILDGDWAAVEEIVSKPLVRVQKALLYSLYRQQFLEHIEHRELQKAFTLLNKRLKPLEHFQPQIGEFRDMCYLLSAKAVHDAPSFRNWEGVHAAREKLVEAFGSMVEGEREEKEDNVFVPPGRLVTMLQQAILYQIDLSRYKTKAPPTITSILQDFSPFIIPNSIARIYEGHTANIKCCTFIGTAGLYIASGSSDNTIRINSTTSTSSSSSSSSFPSTILKGHTSRIWDVDSNIKGDKILSASGDKTVKVWDWNPFASALGGNEEGEREGGGGGGGKKDTSRETLRGNGGDVYAARWHPSGNHIATGGYDKIVRLFDVESGTVLKTFTGHSLSISSTMFNPLGNLIVSGSKDATVRFWDSVSGLCIRTLNAQLGEVSSVDMKDTYLLTSSRDNSIRLWDVRMLRPLRRFKAHSNTSQNFIRAKFAHSTLLVSGSEDGVLYMWDRESSEVLQTLEGHEGVVYGAEWNSRQSLLASYGTDMKVRTWEFDERKGFEFEETGNRNIRAAR